LDPDSRTSPDNQRQRNPEKRRALPSSPRRNANGTPRVSWYAGDNGANANALVKPRALPLGFGAALALAAAAFFLLATFLQAPHQAAAAPGETVASAADVATFNPVGAGVSLLAVVLLALGSGVFAMGETALTALRPSRIGQLVEENRRGAATVKALSENQTRYIATAQVGITVLNFAAAATAATTLAPPFVPFFDRFFDPVTARAMSVAVVTLVVALLAMTLGAVAPRSLAVKAPDVWALRLGGFINLFSIVFAPLTWLTIRITDLLVRPFGARAQFESPVVSEQELKHIIEAGEEAGELEEDEKAMLHNVFGLGETTVGSVMTPRIDVAAVPVASELQMILETILTSGHSRIPVYDKSIDDVVGVVHAKDLLPLLRAAETNVDLHKVMRPALFVPETKSVSELLAQFRRSNQQFAIVQDEYAGTEGIVTIEDLLEEIVGDIKDEYDVDEPEVQVLSATESLVDGRMTIDDVNDRLGTDLPHEDFNTIGGLVFGMLGHEPTTGARVRHDGMEFVVEQVESQRIRWVRIIKVGENAPLTHGSVHAEDSAFKEADKERDRVAARD